MSVFLVNVFICGLLFLGTTVMSANISLARGKPTTQSSTISTYRAHFAVDGNYGNLVEKCAHTGYLPVWWTVDMQNIFAVDEVKLYNRATSKDKLDNLTIEGFPVGDPVLCGDHMSICGFNPGPSGDVVTIHCANNTIARYIRLRGVNGMTVCEVDVFGQVQQPSVCGERKFDRKSGTKLENIVLNLGQADSPTACMILCRRHDALCNVFNYKPVDGDCVVPMEPLHQEYFTNDENWNLYYSCE